MTRLQLARAAYSAQWPRTSGRPKSVQAFFWESISHDYKIPLRSISRVARISVEAQELAITVQVNDAKRYDAGRKAQAQKQRALKAALAKKMEEQGKAFRGSNGRFARTGLRPGDGDVPVKAARMHPVRGVAIGASSAHQEPRFGRQ